MRHKGLAVLLQDLRLAGVGHKLVELRRRERALLGQDELLRVLLLYRISYLVFLQN